MLCMGMIIVYFEDQRHTKTEPVGRTYFLKFKLGCTYSYFRALNV
jgi:hypothetical protein